MLEGTWLEEFHIRPDVAFENIGLLGAAYIPNHS